MDELRLMSKAERKTAYDTVFREAFPPEELKPLQAMERLIAAGVYDFWGLLRDGMPVAYLCSWRDGRYVLGDYLCVPKALRCGGIGSAALKAVLARYPEDTVFIGETEAETGDPARDEMILRRQGLYLRSGAKFLPYDCALFGVHYKTIVWAKDEADPEEVCRRHAGFYRRTLPAEIYAAAVQIPLRPGERPYPARAWKERPDEN